MFIELRDTDDKEGETFLVNADSIQLVKAGNNCTVIEVRHNQYHEAVEPYEEVKDMILTGLQKVSSHLRSKNDIYEAALRDCLECAGNEEATIEIVKSALGDL